MEFRVLGQVEVSSGGRILPLTGPRQRALLAYLLLHANAAVPADRLLDELWDSIPSGGVAALQSQVSRLRRIVGERLVTVGSGYRIDVEPGELDLDRFRSQLAAAAAATSPAERAQLLHAAEALWQSEPLAGIDVPFAEAERAALEELRLGATEERLAAKLENGAAAELVSELSSLAARYPLREGLRASLILALYRSGRQAEALDAYQDARRMLDEELGLEPSPALRELERAILRHDPSLQPVPAPSPEADAPATVDSVATASANRRGPRVAAGLVVAAAAGAGAFALAHQGGTPRALAKQTIRIVTEKVAAPAQPVVRHHATVRPHVHRAQVATHAAAATKATPAAAVPVGAPRTQPTTTAHTAAAAAAATAASRNASTPPSKPVTISDAFATSAATSPPSASSPATSTRASISR